MSMRSQTISIDRMRRHGPSYSMGQKHDSMEGLTFQNTSVLTLADLNRIKQSFNQTDRFSTDNPQIQERQRLKDISEQKSKHWPDTTHSLRRRKDNQKFEQFKEYEEKRRKIDAEEDKYHEGIKKGILDNANKQIFEANDRVKAFQSKMLLAEVVQEQGTQMELNKMIKADQALRDKELHMELLEKVKEGEELEKVKKQKEVEKNMYLRGLLKDQLGDMKRRHVEKIRQDQIEGKLIKLKAEEAAKQVEEEKRQKRVRMLQMQEEIRKGNEALQDIKKKELEKERAEEAKIEEYANNRDEITGMRKWVQEMRFKQRQDVRQKMIEAQAEKLMQIKKNEEERVNKEVAEKELKEENLAKLKQEKRVELVRNIEQFRALSVQKKREEQETRVKEERSFQDYWRKRVAEMDEQERKEKQTYRDQCKFLQELWKRDVDSKQKKVEMEILKDLQEAEKIKFGLQDEENNFKTWAERCIKEWSDNGKNIKPLISEMNRGKLQPLGK